MLKQNPDSKILVIGAGVGGLSAALRLAAAGRDVLVVEKSAAPGGKLRSVPSAAGPVDTGPTVLTMLPVFEEIFAQAGEQITDHLSISQEETLARHWWPDGTTLDLFADREASAEAVREFAGAKAEDEFRNFCATTARLFQAFEKPVMQSEKPNLGRIIAATLARPDLISHLRPGRTLWKALSRQFSDHRLRQLFARYATYVGGSPFLTPALISLIWHAEASGVWTVGGGMAKLAKAFEAVACRHGAHFQYDDGADRIERNPDGTFHVHMQSAAHHHVRTVLFNGDPAALANGHLGPDVVAAVKARHVEKRALSAWVWAFAAEPTGRALAHHNVFFNTQYRREFQAIDTGIMPDDSALYVCAQDRQNGFAPDGPERFEIIINGAPVAPDSREIPEEYQQCLIHTFTTLAARGLHFDQIPGRAALSTPHDFARRFPGSGGSLYGQSPHGMMASFRRPVVRSRIPGLYLAGGGVHPGAGLPMAATSGRLAAEAILKDLALTSRSRRTVTHGGMSTDFQTVGATASRSSVS
ncbi:MAG: 1-hydroxycarotenoid 3,4-desaturase CrtD [Pseudomonadota bacterium]